MSHYAMESVLWKFINDPKTIGEYQTDADSYLAQYQLAEDERLLIKTLDVREMVARDVSPLLTIGALMLFKGPEGMGEYMERMNAPKA